MAKVKSNYQQIAFGISQLAQALNMRRRVRGGRRLGELVVEDIAMSILRRSVNEQVDPQGNPYPDLNPRYLKWKVAHGYSPKKNVMTGRMLSLEEIRGDTVILADQVVMTYGKSDETRQLAEWAEEGQKRGKKGGRPARRFYDLDKQAEDHIDQILDSAIVDVITNM